MLEYVVVADSCTGAVEVAAKFMNGGYQSTVTADPRSLGSLRDYPVVALDTETFALSPEKAQQKMEIVARDLLPWRGSAVFFKRIEPHLLGNPAPELAAMVHALEPKCVVVTTALSRNRKSMEEGLQSDPRRAHHEEKPLADSCATAACLRSAGIALHEIPKEEIRKGKGRALLEQDGCYCFGAENDDDLHHIVQSVLKVRSAKDVLWVGSVGLAEALVRASRPFLFVVGTTHPRSVRQARLLAEHPLVELVSVEAQGDSSEAILNAVAQAEPSLRCGKSVVLWGTAQGRPLQGTYPQGEDSFLDIMAETTRELMGRCRIGGLCITGGNCTIRVMQRTKAEDMVLKKEIQEGVTLLSLSGGSFHGLPLISKSASLGGERTLLHCLDHFLQTHNAM